MTDQTPRTDAGRRDCICGRSVLTENWPNHLQRKDGRHGSMSGYRTGYQQGRHDALREAAERVLALEERNDDESVAEGYSTVRRSDLLAILSETVR